MAFLFKSKKNQEKADRALQSREGPPSQSSLQSASARVARNDKGSLERSTPTGSVNSVDNDGSIGSPEQGFGRQRGQSVDRQVQSEQSQPPLQQIAQAPAGDLPLRNGPVAQSPPSNPNAALYPWSQRRLTYTSSHPSPFPRYGAAVNSVSSKEGDIYVMGGLINSATVKGDLWLIEAGGSMACYPLATTAEGPGPRVGHASLLVGNAFIVYGGDTKIEETDVLDETLYLLNTSTRQWSRALPSGPRPSGRYGHSLNILGSKIYIFGGQVEGYFMNDLSAFDLNQLQMPNNKWDLLIANSDGAVQLQGKIPQARTNHSVITYNDKMYLFGGTNGFQWFNDVWCYDPAVNQWAPLDCIGYIPVPREGHAAAVVDDVMYIFGGRTEDGNDLGDLAAFRITSRRWYTFQNMGPSPSPRSGHSMTAVGKSVIVLGGEPSSATAAVNDLAIVYCLDTTKIRYPNDSSTRSNSQSTRRPSDTTLPSTTTRALPSRDGSAGPPDPKRLVGVPRDSGAVGSPNGTRPQAQFSGPTQPEPSLTNGAPNAAPVTKLPRAAAVPGPSGPPPQGQAPTPVINTAMNRVRNASLETSDREVSPLSAKPQSPVMQRAPSPITEAETPVSNGTRTPTQQLARSGSKQAESMAAVEPQKPKPPVSKPPAPRSQGSLDSVSEQPVTVKTVANRPSSPPPPTRQPSNPLSRRSSGRNSQSVMLLKELDMARNRNAWYASELELARKAGYVPNSSLSPTLDSRSAETFDDDDKPLIEALLAMRTELANVQASVDKQAVLAAKQIAEAERQRDAAIQEAVYAKAKLAGFGGSATSTPQLDRDVDRDDRVGETSRKLANALNTQKELHNQLERLSLELEAERKARKLADDTTNAAQKRMADLETYKQQNSLELERLRAELHQAQKDSRHQGVSAAEALATLQLLRVEKEELHRKVEESTTSSKDQDETFESLRRAVVASAETKTVLERMLEEEKSLRAQAEAKLTKLKGEHEASTAELVVATQRLRDAEEAAEQHANEARMHQQAVVSGLEKMSARSVGTSLNKGDADRIMALQAQLSAANALVKKYQQDADTASDRLRMAEERIAGLEAYQEQASREGVTIRRQLQAAMRDTQTLQAANSDLKHKLANQQLEANAITVQHNTLKDLLAERGISPTSAVRSRGLNSPRHSPDQERLQHLEQELAAAHAAHEETKNSFESQALEAEAQAQEAETQYREKLAQLENDYLSAVQYVKGTEKMLKQLKDQLSRFKTENSRLKEQLVELEDKLADDAANAKAVPQDWESERAALQSKIDSLQSELQSSSSKLEAQLNSIRQELDSARRERDDLSHDAQEANHLLSTTKSSLEQLQQDNAALERRALDAEQKVTLLLDQVETSVDTYRRRSRQPLPSESTNALVLPNSTSPPNHPSSTGTNGNHHHHIRQISDSEAGSVYDEGTPGMRLSSVGNARDSTALDNLANELETLRSHWEATNKNYRLSNTFDFEGTGATVTPTRSREDVVGGGQGQTQGGLSESLADWRKRLDDNEGPGAAR
ncbi:hypothetical protein GE09DRAFT_1172786 [Coniochaeta sp. 2T2.1]|nr:hypothetical protein GE09DRAFT_1172786 [Coniochaeta sp. 2T2.1]